MTQSTDFYQLQRRGFRLGSAPESETHSDPIEDWKLGKPVLLKAACLELLDQQTDHIASSQELYHAVLDEQLCEDLFDVEPYNSRLSPQFESLGCSVNEGDDQEVETILYDAIDANSQDKVLAEDLWIKVSWLSFHEEDASLRFRFSFGMDFVEDVAADTNRQYYASQLTEAIFPESKLITDNATIQTALKKALECDEFQFVERIIYFNAPNGGAYLHHDRERGHAGVVYAQVTGHTFWLALTKQHLLDEITQFVTDCESNGWPNDFDNQMKQEVLRCSNDNRILRDELETFCNSALIHLINETPAFIQHLISQGHSRRLEPGDVLLLPQDDELSCCWHSVFCLGEEPGEAMSFAIRGT